MKRFIPALLVTTMFRAQPVKFLEVCALTKTVARLRTGSNHPQNSLGQVAIFGTVTLHSLYCVDPPTARMRTS